MRTFGKVRRRASSSSSSTLPGEILEKYAFLFLHSIERHRTKLTGLQGRNHGRGVHKAAATDDLPAWHPISSWEKPGVHDAIPRLRRKRGVQSDDVALRGDCVEIDIFHSGALRPTRSVGIGIEREHLHPEALQNIGRRSVRFSPSRRCPPSSHRDRINSGRSRRNSIRARGQMPGASCDSAS